MELIVTLTGQGKYTITDTKDRKIYSITKKRKLMGNPITTLHDASGYVLYTLVRTREGLKPAFRISLNDELFLDAECKSLFVDPCITLKGDMGMYELQGKEYAHLEVRLNKEKIGTLDSETQANGELQYRINVEDKYYDDYVPLFAVVADKCFNGTNK